MYSIGHSNRSWSDFLAEIRKYPISTIVDIRSDPTSRYCPHFNKPHLANLLPANGIQYKHIPELGGRRSGPDTGENLAWENKSFRSYADYALTPNFQIGMAKLIATYELENTAFMCSEAVPWRCHRNIVSNALAARDISVQHIGYQNHPVFHKIGMFGPWPSISQDRLTLTYPLPQVIECIHVIRWIKDMRLATAVKYIWRVAFGGKENDREDIEKAIWYLKDWLANPVDKEL